MVQSRRLLLVLFACLSSGCVQVQTIRPDNLEGDSVFDIVVVTKDARTIEMSAGDYQIVGSGDLRAIQGKGKMAFNRNRTQYRQFEGTIMFRDISLVETVQYSGFHWTHLLLLAVPLALAIVLGISLQGRSFAGWWQPARIMVVRSAALRLTSRNTALPLDSPAFLGEDRVVGGFARGRSTVFGVS